MSGIGGWGDRGRVLETLLHCTDGLLVPPKCFRVSGRTPVCRLVLSCVVNRERAKRVKFESEAERRVS